MPELAKVAAIFVRPTGHEKIPILHCFIAVSLAAMLTDCATGDFTPYSGAQQNWPTAPEDF